VTEAAAVPPATGVRVPRHHSIGVGLLAPVAWRNLWRNRRRTALTASGVGFAVALLAFAIAQQIGSYGMMIDNATALLTSHVQVQRRGHLDDPRIERTLPDAAALRRAAESVPGVTAVTERIMAFVLVSAGERSFAGQLMGVDPVGEAAVSTLPKLVKSGRYLAADAGAGGAVEVYAGAVLARNLGVGIGDEIVILGTDPEGGVAALVTRLVGTFSSGQAELDRSLLQVPIAAVRDAFSLGDEAHAIVVRGHDVGDAAAIAAALRRVVPADSVVLEWPALIPELAQTIDLDRTSGRIFYGLLALLVTFSVVNSFVMLVFERTHEFGMLLAIGMRPWAVIAMLQLEALWLGALGAAGGLLVAVPLIAWVSVVGIPLGEASGDLLRTFHMPDRMYTALDVGGLLEPVALMVVATLLAALVPSLRVRRLRAAEALRAQ